MIARRTMRRRSPSSMLPPKPGVWPA